MPTILAFQSNPDDLVRLQLDKELREISLAIAPVAKKQFKVISLGAARISDLPRYLMEHDPEIFHFSGHGTSEGELVFQDEDGVAQPVTNTTLNLLFQKLGRKIQCVVFSSCFSEKQARQFCKFVPYVIGNTAPIEDSVAIVFSSNFYGALSYGYSIEESFEIARATIGASNPHMLKLPKLYRPKTGSNKILFTQPIVKARFELNKAGKPKKSNNLYDITVWVEHMPKDTISVVYNYNHETVADDIEEFKNDASGIESSTSLYGNIQLRITLWFRDEGIGICTTLFDALNNFYRNRKVSPAISQALTDIEEN